MSISWGKFLCALTCLALELQCAVFAAGVETWEERREALKARPRSLILNFDGCEMIYYPTNAPITPEGHAAQFLSKYIGSKITTVSYCPQSSGFGHMTTMRAGEFFDTPIPLREGCTNATALFAARGLDCLDMTTAFCRTNGMEVFVSIRVNDTHDRSYIKPGSKPPRSWLFPKWKEDNPDCLCGTLKKRPPFASWTAVDFENPKVREYMKEFVSEFANDYDVDGIEYDFMRHGPILKSVAWGAYATEAQLKLMTDFMVELRAITEAAGRKRGRPILVLVRTSDSLAYAKALGIDVEAWLKAGVMDLWSVSDYFQLDYLKPNVELAHKYGVRFYSALAESRIQNVVKRKAKDGAKMLPGRNTIPSYMAEASTAFAMGCDGIESFNLKSIWNKVNAPELLTIDPRHAVERDKIYFACVRGSGGYRPESWLRDGDRFYRRPRIDPGNPVSLASGEILRFAMELGDDPGELKSASVKVLFTCKKPVLKSLSVNGLEFVLGSFDEGVHVFNLGARGWRKGMNEISLMPVGFSGRKVMLNDFAFFVNNTGNGKGKDIRK